jgi:hypothetical protein
MSTPFVPIHRQFPTSDTHNLEKQLVNFHVQTNTAVNNRTIGEFQTDITPNGERWFPTAAQSGTPQRLRDGFRIVVQVSDSVLVVNHNITQINQVTRLYGDFFDGTVWWPLPYVDLVAVNNQINVKVSMTQIIVTKGAGAPPSISQGIVVLEYL